MSFAKGFAPSTSRKVCYSIISFVLGLWTFQKVNEVSGPQFEPILKACTDPDLTVMENFVTKTGYHAWEPMVGLKAFNPLVCLITQFLLELRETYPAGLFVWGTIVAVVGGCTGLIMMVESGRLGLKKYTPINYPIVMGLFFQLFGISVMFPLVWVPGYIWGYGNGPISSFRLKCLIPLIMPGILLSMIVFTANTDSYLWTVSAGIIGGPILALISCMFWMERSRDISLMTKESMENSLWGIKSRAKQLIVFTVIAWYFLFLKALKSYGSLGAMWDGIWTDAGPSVKFMTIDVGILFFATLLWISFHSEALAVKALLYSLVLGPGAGPLKVMGDIEDMKHAAFDFTHGEKNKNV